MSDQETKVADATTVEPTTTEVEVMETATENGATESTKPEAEAEAEAGKSEDAKDETKDETKDEDKPVGIRNPPKNMLRVKRPDRNDAKEKANKFDATILKDSSDPKEIRDQVSLNHPSLPARCAKS
jgi:hypothetical protein